MSRLLALRRPCEAFRASTAMTRRPAAASRGMTSRQAYQLWGHPGIRRTGLRFLLRHNASAHRPRLTGASARATWEQSRLTLSVGCGWIGGGKEIAVNFPMPPFLAKDEQFVVRFLRCRMGREDLLLSGRSGAAIRQVAHLNDFVYAENDVQFKGLEDVLIARLHRITANEGNRVLGHKDRIASIKSHCRLRIACVECFFVSFEQVCDFLVHDWFCFG
jgi:hypothetical protein